MMLHLQSVRLAIPARVVMGTWGISPFMLKMRSRGRVNAEAAQSHQSLPNPHISKMLQRQQRDATDILTECSLNVDKVGCNYTQHRACWGLWVQWNTRCLSYIQCFLLGCILHSIYLYCQHCRCVTHSIYRTSLGAWYLTDFYQLLVFLFSKTINIHCV